MSKFSNKNRFGAELMSLTVIVLILTFAIYQSLKENQQLEEDNEALKVELIRLGNEIEEMEGTIEKKDKAIFSHEANRDKLLKQIEDKDKAIAELKGNVDEKERVIVDLREKAKAKRVNQERKKQEVASKKKDSQANHAYNTPNKEVASSDTVSTSGYTGHVVDETNEQQTSTVVGNFHATYYGADCAGCSGITAGGANVSGTQFYNGRRVVAADPSVLPIGTVIRVKGSAIGDFEGIVMDTGGAIKGNRLDILVGSEAESSSYGRSNVQVEVL